MSELKIGVGASEKWDAREAGKEVAKNTLEKIGDTPDFVLLFSTIHYKDYGGFGELLDGIYEILPKNTPLVGGTVAGFIIPQGCYVHGVTAMGVKSTDIDFAIAVEKNIKKNPEVAAVKCASKIKKILSNSKFPNKFLLNLPSGVTTPKIPGYPENQRIIRSKVLSKLLLLGTIFSLKILQKGPGREEGIIEKLAEELPEYKMIGGSFVDDNKGYSNYQFYNNQVHTNMLITLAISTNYGITVNSSLGLIETGQKFEITKKSTYDLVIEEINGKKAVNELLRILDWPKYFLEENIKTLHRTIYTPIEYIVDGKRYISVIAFIFGDNIMVTPKIRSKEAQIMVTSGKELIKSVESNLEDSKNRDINFGIIASCCVRLETLGRWIYKTHEILVDHFKDKPFIQIYVVGEDVYTKEIGAKRIAESYNSAIFYNV